MLGLVVGLTSAAAGVIGQGNKSALEQAQQATESSKELANRLQFEMDLSAFVDRVPHALSATMEGAYRDALLLEGGKGQAIAGLLDAALTLVGDSSTARVAYYQVEPVQTNRKGWNPPSSPDTDDASERVAGRVQAPTREEQLSYPVAYRQGWRGGSPPLAYGSPLADDDRAALESDMYLETDTGERISIALTDILRANRFTVCHVDLYDRWQSARAYDTVAIVPIWLDSRPRGVLWAEHSKTGALVADHEGPLRLIGLLIATIIDRSIQGSPQDVTT